jgi:uncharacterized membrane protein
MNKSSIKHTFKCAVCNGDFSLDQLHPVDLVGDPLLKYLTQKKPDIAIGGYICSKDLAEARMSLVHEMLVSERGELEAGETMVLESLKHEGELLSRDIYGDYDSKISTGERIADKVAEFGGSWKFIIIFGCVLFVWIAFNSIGLLRHPFDPFPFILLNLVLSCIAAIQAPVIMMSQNRKETKDRLRSENDYKVNLKAELEIRNLQTKIDLLISHQWQRLLEIQEIQTVMLNELTANQPEHRK